MNAFTERYHSDGQLTRMSTWKRLCRRWLGFKILYVQDFTEKE